MALLEQFLDEILANQKESNRKQEKFAENQEKMSNMLSEMRIDGRERDKVLFGNKLTNSKGVVIDLETAKKDITELKQNKREAKLIFKIALPVAKYLSYCAVFMLGLVSKSINFQNVIK